MDDRQTPHSPGPVTNNTLWLLLYKLKNLLNIKDLKSAHKEHCRN